MNKIYVFSGTGTCLQVAKNVAKSMDKVEIISIPKLIKKGNWEIKGNRVGFIFPCYYGVMPQLVKTFIREAKNVQMNYAFGVVTAGGDIGYSLLKLDEALKEKRVDLSYGKSIIIASNYMNGWYYSMLLPKKEKINSIIKKSEEMANKIGLDIKVYKRDIDKRSYLGYKMPTIISPSRYVEDTRPWDSEFSVSEACDGCTICSKVCPVDNITMKTSKPDFNHNCQRCMACIQYCPKSAFVIKGKLMNKPKYTHPHVSLTEIIEFNN